MQDHRRARTPRHHPSNGQHLGYLASFELFPGGSYDEMDLKTSMRHKPVARVTLAKHASVATEDYSSLFRSDTNRAPYTQAPLSTSQTKALITLDRQLRVGPGRILAQAVVDLLVPMPLSWVLLATLDAHRLIKRAVFEPFPDPQQSMILDGSRSLSPLRNKLRGCDRLPGCPRGLDPG